MIDERKNLPSPDLFNHPNASRVDESRLILQWAVCRYSDDLVLASSLGPQSLVILDLLQMSGHTVRTLLLDTGFLFKETLELRRRVEEFFGIEVESVTPEKSQKQVDELHGTRLWAREPAQCCGIRKVEPLRRVLDGASAWITGIRRSHSSTRSQAQPVEWDEQYGLAKVNPLVSWTREEVMRHLESRGIPFNPLLKDGYPSVGCMPCTKRVSAEDAARDERAGRWSGSAKTECGLHLGTVTSPNKRAG